MSDDETEFPFDFPAFFDKRLAFGKPPPEPDPIDPALRPHAVCAGANKRGLIVCAICGKPGTPTPLPEAPRAFFFRDDLSAREYRISATCQACQDFVFADPEEGE